MPVVIAIGLLVGYILLSVFTAFNAVSARFVELLTAFTKNFSMAYVLIPIYLGWFIADYYQERRGTSFGNAISNGFMGLWVGLDWLRTASSIYSQSGDLLLTALKGIFAVGMLVYAGLVMRAAAQGKKIAHFVGRIREISYFAIVFTPIVYGVVDLDLLTIVSAILFFPIIYGIAELIDYYILPPSRAEIAEEAEAKTEKT